MKQHLKLMHAALAGAILFTSPAIAKEDEFPFEAAIVKDRKDVSLDPDKAYILLQAPGANVGTFFKVPTEAEREKDYALRSEALVEAREKWAKKMVRYEKARERYDRRGDINKPEKPVEPTETSFAWQPLEMQFMVSVGPFNRFAKGDGNSLYLQEVPAGVYVYYGAIDLGLGVCTCMGTVKFDVTRGKVTTLRSDRLLLDKDGNPINREDIPEGTETNDIMVRVAMVIEPADEATNDPRIPEGWITPATFEPVAFVPNWYGAEINRLWPMPGVFAYDRGTQIDLKAQAAEEEAALLLAEQQAAVESATVLEDEGAGTLDLTED